MFTVSRVARCCVSVLFCLIAIADCSRAIGDGIHQLDWSNLAESANQIEVTNDQDRVSLVTQGNDGYFSFQIPRLAKAERDWVFEIEYFCPQGVSGLEWRTGPVTIATPARQLPDIAPAEGWSLYSFPLAGIDPSLIGNANGHKENSVPVRIDLGRKSDVRLQIRSVRIRQANDRELASKQEALRQVRQKKELADRIQNYQSTAWLATIESITSDNSKLTLSGRFTQNAELVNPFAVVRFPESISANSPSESELQETWECDLKSDRSFEVSIPLTKNPSWATPGARVQIFDRSGQQATPVTPAVYTPVQSIGKQDAPPTLHAAKGLTCITARFANDQLRELGLQHASVNLVVSGIVSETPRPRWMESVIHGRTWWVNEPRLRHLDRDVKTANDAGAVVAGILLIPTSKQNPDTIEHPEATNAGTYAMPNFVDRNSIATYAAALDVLGRRYSGSESSNGRMDHWIVHNEVDYGWQWTNMGEQPMDAFMDHYTRSMRLVDAAVRRYNPHAQAFISLTHRWNTKNNRHWKTYAPKAMMKWLIKHSQLEGDFPWGVAYHPYPQSLWKADFWNDSKVSGDFDTELITVKNLTVLDRFMHLDSSRTHQGKVRPVLCSEQGFHANENDPQQLRQQAAALLLTWQTLRECPSILAFDYHRPSDHPREGGLRLGLRGLPNETARLGVPKPAWEVFSAIGTDREPALVKEYESVWKVDADR